MFLFWGADHLCFYNAAYRPSLGNEGKHPDALGKPGAEVWPETWPIIKPQIDQVLSCGEASWFEDQLLPIYRNGKLEKRIGPTATAWCLMKAAGPAAFL